MKTILFALVAVAPILAADKPAFRAEDIDTKIEIGYGLAIADVNGDGKKDILLADKNQIVWYENPAWTKQIMTEKLTQLDHVCIAAMDIDGDGKAEVAAGAGWNPGDTVNSGALFYLIPPADRTQKWEPVALHHEPTIHRIKWIKGAEGKYGLVSIPLHGVGNKNGEGAGVKHEFYQFPNDVKSEWPRTLVNEDMHMTHNFNVLKGKDQDQLLIAGKDQDQLLIAGKEGIKLYSVANGKWSLLNTIASSGEQGFAGAGEVRDGSLSSHAQFIAAVEPMHGSNVVVYTSLDRTKYKRAVLDSSLLEGHAVAVGDYLGKGSDQFVVGWRGKLGAAAGASATGVKIFVPNADGSKWTSEMIDDKGMACEDIAAADLNGDGKLDLIAAGRATHNVRIYWNESK